MIKEEIRSILPEESLVFDDPSFDKSIIGVTNDDRVVYDYDKMVVELAAEDECSIEDAMDYIDYNTIRSLNYTGDQNKPIVLFRLTKYEEE